MNQIQTNCFRRRGWRHVVSVVLALALVAPRAAHATPTNPTPAEMSEARARYERALALTEEGNYDEALLEFQRAYAVAPTYKLLYNLAVVSVAVHDYVKAVDYFERYLIAGGTEVEPVRAADIDKQLERLRARIATIRVTVNVPGADVAIDDVVVGKAPLAKPITVNPGRHRVSASSTGYFPTATVVELAGRDDRPVALSLVQEQVAQPVKPSRPLPWVAYGVTAALGAGATVTGLLALGARDTYKSKADTLGASADEVASSYRTMRALSITCDALLVGTVVMAGISTYLTLRSPKEKATASRFLPNGLVF
jgi:hypothetical protein